jgi:hypothetical protein
VAELYSAYTTWCDENGERGLKQRTFGMRMWEWEGFGERMGGGVRRGLFYLI